MAFRAFRRAVAATSALLATLGMAAPASAQFFWKSPDLRGSPVTGGEPGLLVPLPGATPAELRASLVWNLRSGLNVAALQCQFNPTLLTLNHYNHLIDHHRVELADAFRVLANYFKRTVKGAKAGQGAFDQYGTRTYSGFSTVSAQLTFCQTAGDIGRDAIFAKKGQLHAVAAARMQELRNSLKLGGEQQFRFWIPPHYSTLPSLDERCWKGNEFRDRCRVRAA